MNDYAFIALGSNLGNSRGILTDAMGALAGFSEAPLLRSSIWQTTPVDCPPGSPPFLNAAVGLLPKAHETPESLLEKLQALEKHFGRKPKTVLNESRPLDLDLITFRDLVRQRPELTLPHPRAHQRRFVLAPLAEIAPGLVLPGKSQTVRELLDALRTDEVVTRLPVSGGSRSIRTALIGCGKVGGLHAGALATLSESTLVACCDAAPVRAEAFAARYGGRAFSDVASLVRESGAEAVFICTPHPLHAESAIVAAEAGLHVMIEKPMAATLADCDRMLAAAEKSGVALSVMSQRRFYEPVRRMKAAIRAGKIGRPVLGVFLMFSWRDEAYYRSDPWRGKWESEGGGVLVNQSPHQLDLLRWFMGEVEEISGSWANLNHPYIEVDDTAVATLRFKNGGLGSIVTSLSQRPGLFTKVHIHGSNGASVGVETDRGATFIAGVSGIAEPPLNDIWTIPGEESLLDEFQVADRARFASLDPVAQYHSLQIQEFLQAVQVGRPPAVTGADGRAVVEMFSAIYKSNETRAAVRLPLG